MSAAEHNPSRRALLGAAVALPLIGGGELRHPRGSGNPSLSPLTHSGGWIPDQVRDDGKWARALAAFRAAEAELSAFERRTAGAPWEEQEAVERGMEERLDSLCPALLELVFAVVPDLDALAIKIALIEEHEVATLDGGEAYLGALLRDVRELARG